jgi:hypothetical protein
MLFSVAVKAIAQFLLESMDNNQQESPLNSVQRMAFVQTTQQLINLGKSICSRVELEYFSSFDKC